MRFRDIIGQREVVEKLISTYRSARVAHTQIFTGGDGNQKLAVAVAYAQFLNCKNKILEVDDPNLPSADSCGICTSCAKFSRIAHPDLHFFFPNNTNSLVKKDSYSDEHIDTWREFCLENSFEFSFQDWTKALELDGNKQAIINIRDCNALQEKLLLKNYEADFRTIIIYLPEKISDTISSTLLKTLEEPNPKNLIILVSENSEEVLGTILSRTQRVQFPPLKNGDISQYLQEKLSQTTANADKIASLSNGSMNLAKEILQSGESFEGFEDDFETWMRMVYKVDVQGLVSFCSKLEKTYKRTNVIEFLLYVLSKLRICFLQHESFGAEITGSEAEKKFIMGFSPFIDAQNIGSYYNHINKVIHQIQRNANISASLMDVSLKFCRTMAEAKKKKNG